MPTRLYYTLWLSVGILLAAALGFFYFWPASLAALIVATLFSPEWLAIALGVALDVAYGPPPHLPFLLHIPFTLLAVILVVLRLWVRRVLLQSRLKEDLRI